MTSEKSPFGTYFLLSMIILYALVFALSPSSFWLSLERSYSIFLTILPVFALVFLIMAAFNCCTTPKQLADHLGKKSGIRGWIIAVVAGIISAGPIYMWYPLLNELQKQGVRNGILATFLYNRAIKPPLLPMIIIIFGLKYTIVLSAVMIAVSILQGIMVERILEVKI